MSFTEPVEPVRGHYRRLDMFSAARAGQLRTPQEHPGEATHTRLLELPSSTWWNGPVLTVKPNLAGLRRKALILAWITVGWNVIEAAVALYAGSASGSQALIGFGLDSTIEVASAAVIIWQFSGPDEERERLALRLIAISFYALAIYVGGQALFDLLQGNQPDPSPVGIGLAIASLIVMPVLATMKRSTGQAMHSATVTADSKQTWLCTYLSAVLLAGLVLNATMGWWWADPIAALIIAGLAVKEGREAWRGETCCDVC